MTKNWNNETVGKNVFLENVNFVVWVKISGTPLLRGPLHPLRPIVHRASVAAVPRRAIGRRSPRPRQSPNRRCGGYTLSPLRRRRHVTSTLDNTANSEPNLFRNWSRFCFYFRCSSVDRRQCCVSVLVLFAHLGAESGSEVRVRGAAGARGDARARPSPPQRKIDMSRRKQSNPKPLKRKSIRNFRM